MRRTNEAEREHIVSAYRDHLMMSLDGAATAAGNADSLLRAAAHLGSDFDPPASFIAAIAAEELGKAILLHERVSGLIGNTIARVTEHMTSSDEVAALARANIDELPSWRHFTSNPNTHLRNHREKLTALRNYYALHCPRAERISADKLLVHSVDLFGGKHVRVVRTAVEGALYTGWDETAQTWTRPTTCTNDLLAFLDAMRDVSARLSDDVAQRRSYVETQLPYLELTARQLALDLRIVFEH